MAMIAKAATGAFKALGKIKTPQWKNMKKAFGPLKSLDLQGLMSFVMNLKIVQVIMKPLNALFKVFVNAVMKPLFPVIKPLIKALLSLMPIVEKLGTIIGEFLAEAITAIMPFLEQIFVILVDELMPALAEFEPLLYELIPILIELMPLVVLLVRALVMVIQAVSWLVRWLYGSSPGLIPGFEWLIKLFEGATKTLYALINMFHELISLIDGILMNLLKFLIEKFHELVRIIADSVIGTINSVTRALNAFANVLREIRMLANSISIGGGNGGGGNGDGGIFDWIPEFQRGTLDFGPRRGLAILDPHEAVIPADMKGGLGKTINININLSGAVIADPQSLKKLADMLTEQMFVEMG